ncbi:10380_t:CDS:10, partial [Ambispora leptoticha]
FGQSRHAKWALFSSFAQAIIIGALEAVVYTMHKKEVAYIRTGTDQLNKTNDIEYKTVLANAESISVYHILFMASQVFQLVLCVDALYHENTIQLIALTLFTFGTLSYSVIQTVQSATLIDPTTIVGGNLTQIVPALEKPPAIPFEITIIVLMVIFSFVFAYLAYKLYQEFGWSIYKRIGADLSMRDRYKMYQIFIMLLKFDIFFFVGFTVQFLVLLINRGNALDSVIEHIVLSTVASTAMLIVAFWGVQTERKFLMYAFMVGCLGTEGYIISKLVDVAQYPEKYIGTRIFVTFFLCCVLILGVATFIISFACLRNFNKGLKFHLTRRNVNFDSTDDVSAPPGYAYFRLRGYVPPDDPLTKVIYFLAMIVNYIYVHVADAAHGQEQNSNNESSKKSVAGRFPNSFRRNMDETRKYGIKPTFLESCRSPTDCEMVVESYHSLWVELIEAPEKATHDDFHAKRV